MKLPDIDNAGKPEGLSDIRNAERLAAFERESEKRLQEYIKSRRQLMASYAEYEKDREERMNQQFPMAPIAPIAWVALTIFAVLFAVLYFTQ